jgi:hypothetical protein
MRLQQGCNLIALLFEFIIISNDRIGGACIQPRQPLFGQGYIYICLPFQIHQHIHAHYHSRRNRTIHRIIMKHLLLIVSHVRRTSLDQEREHVHGLLSGFFLMDWIS